MSDKRKDQIREAAAYYPKVYELRYMNADTPRMSGAHYLEFGYREGAEWADLTNPEVNRLTYELDKSRADHMREYHKLEARIAKLREGMAKLPCIGNGTDHLASCYKCKVLSEDDKCPL